MRHAALDVLLDAIANDRRHVAVLGDVLLVGQAAVTGDHHRAAFVDVARDGDVHDRVQRVDVAIDGAAVGRVDERIHHGREQIAGGEHVCLAEEDEAVAVGVRVRLVDDLHRLTVEQELALLGDRKSVV